MLLNQVRVLDLSQYIPGPYLTRNLADLGAQVIKVEPPGGDPMRQFSADENTLSPVYSWLNRGKKIVRLDLKSKSGILKLKQLLSGADILIDGFRPGVLNRLGFSREKIQMLNPKLIYCALTGFGQTGPYSQHAGHDLGYCAVAGMLSTTKKNKAPNLVYPPLADHVGSLQASNTILAALYSREKSGKGVFIDASLYEPVLSWNYLTQSDHIAQVLGGDAAYYNVYQTADDRYISLSALEEKFWNNFCQAIGKEVWQARHSDPLPQDSLIREVVQLFKSRNLSDWNACLSSVDCCYEPITEVEEITAHPQTQYRKTVDHYPNLVNDQLLSSTRHLDEIVDVENLAWE